MPNIREKLASGKQKLSTKIATGKAKMRAGGEKLKLKVRVVGSKLREEGPRGARRCAWLLLAAFLYYQGWSIFAIIQLFIGLAALLFIGLPFVFKYSPYIQRNLVFLPFIRMPKNVNFSDPASEGLPGTKNFYLETEPGVQVGVWQVLPRSLVEHSEDKDSDWWDAQLNDGRTVVLYLHGNTAHRAGEHRKELYQVLRGMDLHVVAFDYRGYADSSKHIAPTETGVVRDARTVYEWLASKAAGKVIVWGHSLGTAISSHLVADLCQEDQRPCALVLESPFNNIFDEVRNHPMGWLWRKMPWYDWFFTAPLATNDLGFVSDQRVQVIDVPIMILHAEDDLVVPFKLGKALFESAQDGRAVHWPKVHWKEFSGEHGYAHKFICRAPELPNIFREFEKGCDETHVNMGSALKIAESESESNIEESDSDMDTRRREVKNNTLE